MASDSFTVTPWEVSGRVDYDRLIREFGTQAITGRLAERLERLLGDAAYLVRRRVFFSHRDLDLVLKDHETGRGFFLYTGTEISTAQWSFTLFTLARGVPELTASTWIGIYWGIFTLGRIFFGLIANRVRLDPILRLALVLAALGAALLWWNPANWVSFGGLVVMGLAFAPIFPILIATTVNRVGHAHSSNAIGFQIAAAGLGGAVLTGLIGVFASATTLENIGLSILLLVGLTLATYVWLARTASSNPH